MGIRAFIELCMEFGFSKQGAQDKTQKRFNLSEKDAAEYMKKYYTTSTIVFSGTPSLSGMEVTLPDALPSASADDGIIRYGYSLALGVSVSYEILSVLQKQKNKPIVIWNEMC